MGLKALLLDLDDTLLGNSMAEFGPVYFRALTAYVAHEVPPERLLSALLAGTRAMDANDGHGPTNEEAFAAVFYPALGRSREELEPLFWRFYREEFPRLRHLTQRREEARPLVEWALANGLQVVIATHPLFPRVAIEERLAWAGVPVREFAYALVTSYEVMHATKASPAYYDEIAALLGRQPAECLMAGDDWQMDIAPAAQAGMRVYWVAPAHATPPTPGIALAGRGSLTDLLAYLQAACGAHAAAS